MISEAVQIEAPAKVNLYLDVLGKRDDGYHQLETIMQSISLCDFVTIIPDYSNTPGEIELITRIISDSSKINDFPVDESNLIIRAVRLLLEQYEFPAVKVILEKYIPLEAGLAGGSSNAAATLFGVNELFDLGLSQDDLARLGAKLGSDVPFCVYGGTMLATGRGEELHPMNSIPNCYFVLVKPEFGSSTAQVYSALNMSGFQKNNYNELTCADIISSLEKGTLTDIVENMYNKMEPIVINWFDEMMDIYNKLKSVGALKVMMTGSGSTVVGVYSEYQTALLAKNKLECEVESVYISIPRQLGVGKENS